VQGVYTKEGSRSRRSRGPAPRGRVVGFEASGEEAMVRLAFPMGELVARLREGLESLACQAGLLLAEAVVRDEVESCVGPAHARLPERHAYRWGQEAGYIAFAGRKVAFRRPRVRNGAGVRS